MCVFQPKRPWLRFTEWVRSLEHLTAGVTRGSNTVSVTRGVLSRTVEIVIFGFAISPFRKVAIQINSNAGRARVCHLETDKTLKKEIKRKFIKCNCNIRHCLHFHHDQHHYKSWEKLPCSFATFDRCFACTHTCNLLSSSSLSTSSSSTSMLSMSIHIKANK